MTQPTGEFVARTIDAKSRKRALRLARYEANADGHHVIDVVSVVEQFEGRWRVELQVQR